MAVPRGDAARPSRRDLGPPELGEESCEVRIVRVVLQDVLERKQVIDPLETRVVFNVLEILFIEVGEQARHLFGECVEELGCVGMPLRLDGRSTPIHGGKDLSLRFDG